ncbi:hypothetical protein B0H67DRAFT_321554 [Lasiosphaeris hirsuta]|uniref:Uncharacterized protein n=1 Tax=Lasiosphaeris hirsuta TaxID=260670 RepID=A0AA40A1T4_9PEZI|nr:hypothetical protein B0H67DRAFT_321554 [Lasiosphaeris hirsuta]
MAKLNMMPSLVLATLFAFFFGVLGVANGTGNLNWNFTLGATDDNLNWNSTLTPTAFFSVQSSPVPVPPCGPEFVGAIESGWTCVRPRSRNWCVLALTTHLSDYSDAVDALRADLFNGTCDLIGKAYSKGWGLEQNISSPLPLLVRFRAYPVSATTGLDASEFWYGDGHWVGDWDKSTPAVDVDVSSRVWDCSFYQGHSANQGARAGRYRWVAVLGVVGVPLVLGAVF